MDFGVFELYGVNGAVGFKAEEGGGVGGIAEEEEGGDGEG